MALLVSARDGHAATSVGASGDALTSWLTATF
jgi:hypothetical protein